jgi:twitching motility protein PilT
MARLDSLINKLITESALELQFETNSGITLRTASGPVTVLKQPLTSAQIIGAISELVPADLRESFPGLGSSRFPYMSPEGPVAVAIEHAPALTRVSITSMRAPRASAAARVESSPSSVPPDPFAAVEAMPPLPVEETVPEPPPPRSENRARTATRSLAAVKAAVGAEPRPKTRGVKKEGAARLKALLTEMLEVNASDLHLSADAPPLVRVDGDMGALESWPVLKSEEILAMISSIAPKKNLEQFEQIRDTDFAHETDAARFRVNVFEDRKGVGAVMRQIPTSVRSAEDLGVPKQVLDLCSLTKGLVLVTGPTGSGKSTTLAALVDHVNRTREDHIITIEDPIEFVHPNKKCLVNQREVGTHTNSFKHALRAALREDPDVVLVGELRDLETIAIAIETAETGHLVFGTLHTNTAPSTVDRIIDQFPADRQGQIRTMLSESLKGVISQTLCKKIGGGRVAALEILLVPGSVSNLIREGKTFQIPSVMQTAKGQGMQTLNDALFELVKRKLVEPAEALAKAIARSELRSQLERAGIKVG